MGSTGDVGRDRPRRVLIIVENLPVPFDRRVWQEATTLAEHGYDVSVICPVGADCRKRRELIDGVHIYRHPLSIEAKGAVGYAIEYALALFWEFVLALRIFITRGFDVIQACNPPDTIFLVAGFFKLFFGTKFVFDHHDLGPELYEAKFGGRGWGYTLLVALERLTFRVADVSIATNDSYRKIALERGRMSPEDVIVVRSGPNLDRFRVVPPSQHLKCGRRYLVGYIGVMGKQEGIQYLIEAARYTVHELGRTDIHFGLVGSGPELPVLKDYVAKLGLDSYFTCTGRIPDSELLAMMSTADLCVNPDEVNELNDKSTMNKVVEYMALGKPIVQFDVTEGRVSAQDASLYCRPNDPIDLAIKIVNLLDNPGLRQWMGALGRQRVETDLAWKHQAPRLLAAYDRVWNAHIATRPKRSRGLASALARKSEHAKIRSRSI
jgi:glycosyltransferase involved in cell wall biosynthesis